jgi:hypothetical protein
MKSYKEYEKAFIGENDVARLIIDTPIKCDYLYFGEDGAYDAYIVDENAIIGDHYTKVFGSNTWLKIYDRTGLQFSDFGYGNKYKIYRAGDFGCIIQIIKEDK